NRGFRKAILGVSLRLCQLQKPCSELRALAGVFVFEEDERVLPRLLPDSLKPIAKVVVTIFRAAQAKISPVCGSHKRNGEFVIRIGEAKRGVVLSEKVEHFIVEPRLVSELEGGLTPRRQ